MIGGSSTTWCQVTDMERSIRFYRDVLGLKPLMESPYWTEFALGEGKIALHHLMRDDGRPCGENGKGWYLGLACSDVRALAAMVTSGGGTEYGMHETPSGVVLTFCDPDGNPMQALQAGTKLDDIP